jgi:hypothetical protein
MAPKKNKVILQKEKKTESEKEKNYKMVTLMEFNKNFFNSKNKNMIYKYIIDNKFIYDESHYIYSIMLKNIDAIEFFIKNKYEITKEIKYNIIKHIDFIKYKEIYSKIFKEWDNADLLCACINDKHHVILHILKTFKTKPSKDCLMYLLINYKKTQDRIQSRECIKMLIEKKCECHKNDIFYALKYELNFLVDYLTTNINYSLSFYKNLFNDYGECIYDVKIEDIFKNINFDKKYMLYACKIMNYELINLILQSKNIKAEEKYFKTFLNNYVYLNERNKYDNNYYHAETESDSDSESESNSDYNTDSDSDTDSGMFNYESDNELNNNSKSKKSNSDKETDSYNEDDTEDFKDSDEESDDSEYGKINKKRKNNTSVINNNDLEKIVLLFIHYGYVPTHDDITNLSQFMFFFDKKYNFLEKYVPNKCFYENVICYRTYSNDHLFKPEYNNNMYKDIIWLEVLCNRYNTSKKMQNEIKTLINEYKLKPTTKCKLETSKNCKLLDILFYNEN